MSSLNILIDKNISKYIVFSEESVREALRKIEANQDRIIFSVSQFGVLHGVLTDGDIRRWLLSQKSIDFNTPVSAVANPNFKFVLDGNSLEKIPSYFSEGIDFIPIVDKKMHLVGIAQKRHAKLAIGNFLIDSNSPAFIIAEIGNNHNGDVKMAKMLVDQAVESGADCAKFQMRHLHNLYRNMGNPSDAREDLGSQYTLDLLSRFQLTVEEMFDIFDYCKSKGILPLCTPWDLDSFYALERYGLEGYKVASADLVNHELLETIGKSGKALLCSTGMSTDQEITDSVNILKRLGASYALLHCNSTYPTPFKDVNLTYLSRLKEIGDCLVGYSGHERGYSVPIAAISLGAKIIEKHFTLDRGMEGNDHKVSLLPAEFKQMVQSIRDVEQALGTNKVRKLSQGELMNREVLGKSLVTNRNLKAGETITADMIETKSPGVGLVPYRKSELVGIKARRDMNNGDFFFPSDLKLLENSKKREFKFRRPWGVCVRYHDFAELIAENNMNLVEFHLSYKDLDEKVESYFFEKHDLDMVVHAPELFSGDHILDLCSPNEPYRQKSITELQRVINVTRKIKPFFSKCNLPLIVVNAGGFTQDAPLPPLLRNQYYELILKSVQQLNTEGVELIFQTMPPFPWHYGGQRYQNLFIDPSEIHNFCSANKFRICLDVSHSKLACTYFKWSFKEFVDVVGPHVAHLHLADAEGIDGEGLQISEGEIDFRVLAECLDKNASKASFIPEIWQGHKNGGEGFWQALERLEKWF